MLAPCPILMLSYLAGGCDCIAFDRCRTKSRSDQCLAVFECRDRSKQKGCFKLKACKVEKLEENVRCYFSLVQS